MAGSSSECRSNQEINRYLMFRTHWIQLIKSTWNGWEWRSPSEMEFVSNCNCAHWRPPLNSKSKITERKMDKRSIRQSNNNKTIMTRHQSARFYVIWLRDKMWILSGFSLESIESRHCCVTCDDIKMQLNGAGNKSRRSISFNSEIVASSE